MRDCGQCTELRRDCENCTRVRDEALCGVYWSEGMLRVYCSEGVGGLCRIYWGEGR